MEFQTPTDIGNRALQHCGGTRIDPTLGFNEDSKNAGEVSSCYGKLRQAELRGNVWTFACKRAAIRAVDTDTRLLNPALWVSTTTYFVGSIVSDSMGVPWISRIPDNLGFQPSVISMAWEPYYGPLTVDPYDSGIAYYAGELVYIAAANGAYRTYISLVSGNEDNPATATAWDATVTYQKNDIVTYSAVAYMSLLDVNLNNIPSASPADWNVGTTYGAAASVRGSDGVKYTSLAGGNIGHDPVADILHAFWTSTGDEVPWTTVFVAGSGALTWRQIGGAEFPLGVGLKTLDIVYPIGAGPSSRSYSRNIFKLPANFLRFAPQNPGGGVPTVLGGPTGITYKDWAVENGFITSATADPIILRFVTDVQDVTQMDPMFCEAFAARIGMEVCQSVTQSSTQVSMVAKIYDEWMARAKLQNGIEQGADEPADDDYVTVRL